MILRNEQVFSIFFIYILFMPSAVWFGGIQISIFLFFCMLVFYVFLFQFNTLKIDSHFLFLMSILYIPLLLSINKNYEHIIINDTFELIRISIYLIIYLFSYNSGKNLKYKNIVKVAKFFLIFELIFVLLQRMEIVVLLNVLEYFWDNEKNWIFRNTGSYSNPNSLAFFTIFTALIIIISNNSRKIKLFFWLIGFLIIILTASRTGLIVYIFITSLGMVNFRKFTLYLFIKFIFLLIFMISIFYFIGQIYAEENKYMFELLKILSTGELTSIGTFLKRMDLWENIILKINESTYFFGLGPAKDFGLKNIDNEYLAVFAKYGLFGILITTFVYVVIFYKVYKANIEYYSKLLILYYFQLIIFGFTAETFSSWIYILPLFFILGIIRRKSNMIKNEIYMQKINF